MAKIQSSWYYNLQLRTFEVQKDQARDTTEVTNWKSDLSEPSKNMFSPRIIYLSCSLFLCPPWRIGRGNKICKLNGFEVFWKVLILWIGIILCLSPHFQKRHLRYELLAWQWTWAYVPGDLSVTNHWHMSQYKITPSFQFLLKNSWDI